MEQRIDPDLVERIRDKITEELVAMMGFSRTGWVRRAITPLFQAPASRFARMVALFETETARDGVSAGARRMLSEFDIDLNLSGSENIPADGPLLVVSNHPGAYDSLVLGACIRRKDLKVVVSDVPFMHALPAASACFVPVSMDPIERMGALRASIRHLQSGGALLIFAHGDVEPDPAFMPGAEQELGNWSPSIEVMLRKVPQTRLQIAIASGVLLPRFVHSPITRLRKEPAARQKLAEFLQISQQMLAPQSVRAPVTVSLGLPTSTESLRAEAGAARWMPVIVRLARAQLREHLTPSAAVQPALSTE